MSPSRRDFLKQASAASALGLLYHVPAYSIWAEAPSEFIPEPDEKLLRTLALAAVDAARLAGAMFTDVRVCGVRHFGFGCSFDRPGRPVMGRPSLGFGTDYGIRVIVEGAWGFARGHTPTPDAIARAARTAVDRAVANRPRRPRNLGLAPTPRVENGIWAPAIKQDPFAVPLAEQAELALAAVAAAENVRGATGAQVSMSWSQRVDVFASSEGSLIVQRIPRAVLPTQARGRSQDEHAIASENVQSLRSGWHGYEAVTRIDLIGELRKAAERAVANSKPAPPPPTSVEVGRYDLVLGGAAVGALLRETLGPALNLERVLGYRANHEGTSFAAPPTDILGKYQVGSPLITLHADRTRDHSTASVRWDDEGVPTGQHTLIQNGVILDYLTSRQTAVELSPLYEARGEPIRSHGCMVADNKGRAQHRPEIGIPNLTFVPGEEDVSVEELIADTRRGLFVPMCGGGSDQQLLSGQFQIWDGAVREIRNGKLGRPIKDFAFQFLTPQFWKSLDAVGGESSMVSFVNVQAAAARVREVNVLNTGRKL